MSDQRNLSALPFDGLHTSARSRIAKLREIVAEERNVERRWTIVGVLSYDAEVIERLTLACEAALAHAEGLVMDTPEDQFVVDKLAETLRMALSGEYEGDDG